MAYGVAPKIALGSSNVAPMQRRLSTVQGTNRPVAGQNPTTVPSIKGSSAPPKAKPSASQSVASYFGISSPTLANPVTGIVTAPAKAKKNTSQSASSQKQRKKFNKDGTPKPWWYLQGDDLYQNALADLTANFQLLREGNITDRDNLNADFDTLLKRLQKQQKDDQEALGDDYAARGLFGSLLNQDALNELNINFKNQETDARTSLQRNLAQLTRDLESARTLMNQQKQDAKLNALRRRAEQFGIMSKHLTQKQKGKAQKNKNQKNKNQKATGNKKQSSIKKVK